MTKGSIEHKHPRDQIVFIMNRIYKQGLTTTSGGNISVMDENGDIWITPSGVDKGSLKPSDIMCVNSNGEIIGPHKPSMEYPFHLAIYQSRSDIKSIVHAHPPALVSFSIVKKVPNTMITPHSFKKCGKVGYAKYQVPGSKALGDSISKQFELGFEAVIMENHGVVVGGNSVISAYNRFETLDNCAQTLINSHSIGEPKFLKQEELKKFEEQIYIKYPELDYEIDNSRNKEVRQEICKIVQRACEQGLMMNNYGVISVRTQNNNFLITPANIPRWNIQKEDIVQIEDSKCEQNKVPSNSVWLHQKIYEHNPDINAIIISMPEYLMAYAIAHRKLDVRTIPESWIFLQDIQNVKFGTIRNNKELIPELVSSKNPGVIFENESVLMTGNTLFQAFDRLEVAEFSAKSLAMGISLGKFVPMSDTEIEELRSTFIK